MMMPSCDPCEWYQLVVLPEDIPDWAREGSEGQRTCACPSDGECPVEKELAGDQDLPQGGYLTDTEIELAPEPILRRVPELSGITVEIPGYEKAGGWQTTLITMDDWARMVERG